MSRRKGAVTLDDAMVRQWLLENRGLLSEVAVTIPCTPQFVQQVAYGRSTATLQLGSKRHLVETVLRQKGWPGNARGRKPAGGMGYFSPTKVRKLLKKRNKVHYAKEQ